MATFSEAARYIRSKNAGPFWITIDVFCNNQESFEMLSKSDSLKPEVIARVYKVDPGNINYFYYHPSAPLRFLIRAPFPRGPNMKGTCTRANNMWNWGIYRCNRKISYWQVKT